ncbi:MAG: helix-turn-helix domain-containing protein [Pyrinomonadaceae bacterium]
MATFVALYRGETVGNAQLIAVSADSKIVAEISTKLLKREKPSMDQVSEILDEGRRSALREILKIETKNSEGFYRSQKSIFSNAEAVDYLGLSPTTLWRERKAGKISFRKFGNKVAFTKKDLDDYIEQGKIQKNIGVQI